MPDVIPSSCSTVMSAMSGYERGEVGEHVGDRVVEGEGAGLDEVESARRGERLRDAADARVIVDGRVRAALLRVAIRRDVLPVLGMPDADPDAGEIVRVLGEHVVEASVDGAASSASIGVVLRSMPVNSATSGPAAVVAGAAVVAARRRGAG